MRIGLLVVAAGLTLALAGCKSEGSGAAASTSPNASTAPTSHDAAEVDTFCEKAFGALADQALKGCSADERASNRGRNAVEFAREPLRECTRLRAGVASRAPRVRRECLRRVLERNDVDQTRRRNLGRPHRSRPRRVARMRLRFRRQASRGAAVRHDAGVQGAAHVPGRDRRGPPRRDVQGRPVPGGERVRRGLLARHRLQASAPVRGGLVCDPIADVCKAPVAAGGACKNSFECAAPTACRAGHCAATGPADVGGPCEDDTDDCKPGLFCDKSPAGAKKAGGAAGTCAEEGSRRRVHPRPLRVQGRVQQGRGQVRVTLRVGLMAGCGMARRGGATGMARRGVCSWSTLARLVLGALLGAVLLAPAPARAAGPTEPSAVNRLTQFAKPAVVKIWSGYSTTYVWKNQLAGQLRVDGLGVVHQPRRLRDDQRARREQHPRRARRGVQAPVSALLDQRSCAPMASR